MEEQRQTSTQPVRSHGVEQTVDLELRLCVEEGSASPYGHTRDRSGREQRFRGWLGLLGVLESLCAPEAPSRDSETAGNVRRHKMSAIANPSIAPIALQPGEGEALWFLGCLATIKASTESSAGRVAVIEHRAPRGAGSPLHVHRCEDEWFYVTEGELTFWVGGRVIVAPAGSFVYGPRDVPHMFTVSSERARFVLVVEPAGLEGFIRALAEPARELAIPPAATEPPDVARMTAIAAEYGVEIIGPPGIPTS